MLKHNLLVFNYLAEILACEYGEWNVDRHSIYGNRYEVSSGIKWEDKKIVFAGGFVARPVMFGYAFAFLNYKLLISGFGADFIDLAAWPSNDNLIDSCGGA